MTKPTAKHKILLLSFSFLILLSMEGLSYLLYSPTRLAQIKEILEPHPERFWRGKPNYEGVFFDAPVKHNALGLRAKDNKKADILVMGGSPSYGWGVPYNKTYSYLLGEELGKKVVNGSTVGYSSFQGKKLLKEIFPVYKPRLVTFSYVINDVDHYRFFRNQVESDKNVPALEKESLLAGLGKLYIFKLMSKVAANNQERLPTPNNIRVNKKEYRQNLIEMVHYARNQGAKVLFIKFPVNLPSKLDNPEILNLLPKDCQIRKQSTRDFYLCAKKGKLTDNDLRKLMAISSSLKAKEYNKVMQELGLELDIKVAAATEAFNESKEYLFLDPKLDPIHPNIKGHRILADTVLAVLRD